MDEVINELSQEMEEASKTLDFEKAALMRDRIAALEKSWIKQNVNHPFLGNLDVIAVAGEKKKCFTILLVREGRTIGKHQYVLEADFEDVVTAFYGNRLIPDEVVVQQVMPPLIKEFLERKRGKKVVVITPKRGKRKKLIEMAKKDAEIHLKYRYGELELLKDELGLPRVPERIEGYDVSNIMGKEATASQVCFVNGKPSKKDYRHYRIKTQGIDDYAMIEEVLRRRFSHREVTPDLILIDGGKGHLNVALKTIHDLGLSISVIALAKKEEEVFSERGVISHMSKTLLIKVRDEAHRFAITYHKKLRQKKLKKSILDDISGIGEKRKKLLMNHFRSVDHMKKASLETLEDVLKNKKVAKTVYGFFHNPD